MLVIISGLESVNKNYIAKKVFCAMNPVFNLKNGHTVKFDAEFAESDDGKSYIAHPFQIFNEQNEVVYDTKNRELTTLLNDEVGISIFTEADDLYDALFLDTTNNPSSYETIFVDIEYDLGIDTSAYEWDTPIQYHSFAHGYQDFLNYYRNRQSDVHVVNGSFSKAFIDLIKRDIGEQNVKVYNIIRHPSVVTYFNENKPSYYEKNPTMSPERNRIRAIRSAVNSYTLNQLSDVTSIKFEDILKSGYVEIENHKIQMPEGYADYNGIISVWEKENLNLDYVDVDAVEQTCSRYSNFREELEKEYNRPLPNLSDSLLVSLGYTPITLEQIFAPKE